MHYWLFRTIITMFLKLFLKYSWLHFTYRFVYKLNAAKTKFTQLFLRWFYMFSIKIFWKFWKAFVCFKFVAIFAKLGLRIYFLLLKVVSHVLDQFFDSFEDNCV